MKILRQINFSKKAEEKEAEEKKETKKALLKAGGSLAAGGALGLAIPAVAHKKIAKKAIEKFAEADKKIAAKRGLSRSVAHLNNGEPLTFAGATIYNFKGPSDKVKDAYRVSTRYAKKVNAQAFKDMKKARVAGLAATALGAAGAGLVAYKHYKNKNKESKKD